MEGAPVVHPLRLVEVILDARMPKGQIAQAHAEPVHAPVSAAASGRIFIQAGAFAMPENAQRVRARIASLGNIQVVQTVVNGTPVYRVRLGPVANATEADRLLGKVVGNGYPTARVVSE